MRNKAFLHMGTSPQTPGIYRFRARISGGGGKPPRPFRHRERRSGSIPGEPYPPSRHGQYSAAAGIFSQTVSCHFFVAGHPSGTV